MGPICDGLRISYYWNTSCLILCTKRGFERLEWNGPMARKGSTFCHLRYLLGVNAMNAQVTEIITNKLTDKSMY